MSTPTDVATANVLRTLRVDDARAALGGVLDLAPDLVGLQEWSLRRHRLLRETGSVEIVPRIGIRLGRVREGSYVWSTPVVGGCPVGARADRFELLTSATRMLDWIGRGEREDRPLKLEPPRFATLAVYRDRQAAQTVSLLNYHLTPGVQVDGKYREDRPLLVARHQREVRNVERLVREQQARGHVVYAVGDSNFDGLRLAGLTSGWSGREDEPGTLGARRKVDDVHASGPAASVTLLSNGSDHKAVIMRRDQD
ncbi:MAG: hypothetical protein JWR35_1336 [Marmoricola sp.]|nr:hypothetical protein [Marmoricola sp.]